VQAWLQAHPLVNLTVPCMMNCTAALHTSAAEVTANLITQITSPVRWQGSMVALADAGVNEVLELGVGKVLTGLAPRCDARLNAAALDTREAVDTWLEKLV
jgi:[acyl-carrier-protein] S-malonyltransferase